MVSLTSQTEDDLLASTNANPTPEEILARAESMLPTLVARQADSERRTYYSQRTHDEFSEAGFYRILTPRRYGGYEMGIEPSCGWR